jgi:hypothetical protein
MLKVYYLSSNPSTVATLPPPLPGMQDATMCLLSGE